MTQTDPNAPHLALPPSGRGPGVLLLHAWWGRVPTVLAMADRLAGEGFVVSAPDLFAGKTAGTVEEAERLLETTDGEARDERARAGLASLRDHPAVTGDALGAVGLSLGAFAALRLAAEPDLRAVVLFYGTGDADFARSEAAFQAHFASDDPYEPEEAVAWLEGEMREAGRPLELFRYDGASHWFMEPDRPEHDPEAAALAWERAVGFLRGSLA